MLWITVHDTFLQFVDGQILNFPTIFPAEMLKPFKVSLQSPPVPPRVPRDSSPAAPRPAWRGRRPPWADASSPWRRSDCAPAAWRPHPCLGNDQISRNRWYYRTHIYVITYSKIYVSRYILYQIGSLYGNKMYSWYIAKHMYVFLSKCICVYIYTHNRHMES